MKNPRLSARSYAIRLHKNGFALVISLSLMVLLTILAVGLLGLSSVSLSTAGRETNIAEARSNARMALAMAIAQLQKSSGPDQRITMAADQLSSGAEGDQSAAAETRRHWTGVYDSWTTTSTVTAPATAPFTARPSNPNFRSWLVSGDFNDIKQVDTAKSSGSSDAVELVGQGTVGASTDGRVEVPSMRLNAAGGGQPRIAWWTGDQGIKAALSTPPVVESSALAETRAGVQTAPRNAVELVKLDNGGQPFVALKTNDEGVPKVTDWQQSAFLANDPKAPKGLFHDLAPFSTGLLTNVRTGGFRKDLSMQLERTAAVANTTLVSTRTALYKAGAENGINLQELWAYYNLYKPTELRSTGSAKYTTGGNIPSGTRYFQVESSPAACETDDEFFFKQPTIISYQLALSLGVKTVSNAQVLAAIVDPIITFWNPLDVPVVVPTSSFFSVKYWPLPYSIYITTGGGVPIECPLVRCFTTSDSNFATLEIGRNQQLVLKPGEVVKFSQSSGVISKDNADHSLPTAPGFNFASGIAYPVRTSAGSTIPFNSTMSVDYEILPNGYTCGKSSTSGNVPSGFSNHSRHFSLSHHEVYVGEDRAGDGPSLGYGGMFLDWDFGNARLKPNDPLRTETGAGTKQAGSRYYATNYPKVFKPITKTDTRTLTGAQLLAGKSPIALFSYNAKTEMGTDPAQRTRFLGRFNPKAHFVDFFSMKDSERDMLPYEFTVDALNSWKNRSLESSTNGNGFFGGGMNAEFGVNAVITHSIPREPIVSIAALQHSFANGFEILRPKQGYAILNSREPLLPQISHAIGNSVAPPILQPTQTTGTTDDGRPVADHSYLANNGLWDDWYFSGIAPQTVNTFSKQRAQKTVAEQFLSGTGKLPVVRYMPDASGTEVQKVLASMFSGANPTDLGTALTASMIRVDGLFNVNSTSVEAWKALFGSLKGRPVVTQSPTGSESFQGGEPGTIPVAGLLTPQNAIADDGDAGAKADAQWVGRRTLTEKEIDQLAQAVVKEVRKRGPFLSLADFINRRPGSNKDLARAGAIQCALDSKDVEINSGYNSGDRSVSGAVTGRFKFPEAEQGPSGYGMPGVVKQADILTPIAPVLSARSDSFIVRAYGESVDKDGKVLARAWCEAVVERSKEFLDTDDKPETQISKLTQDANKAFGRRYKVSAFRWLHPDEV